MSWVFFFVSCKWVMPSRPLGPVSGFYNSRLYLPQLYHQTWTALRCCSDQLFITVKGQSEQIVLLFHISTIDLPTVCHEPEVLMKERERECVCVCLFQKEKWLIYENVIFSLNWRENKCLLLTTWRVHYNLTYRWRRRVRSGFNTTHPGWDSNLHTPGNKLDLLST